MYTLVIGNYSDVHTCFGNYSDVHTCYW